MATWAERSLTDDRPAPWPGGQRGAAGGPVVAFSRQAQFRPGEVEYRTDADETALVLRSKDGHLLDAVTGPAMTADLKQRLASAVDRGLAAGTPSIVLRWIMFAGRPVNGTHRHRDALQCQMDSRWPQRAEYGDARVMGDEWAKPIFQKLLAYDHDLARTFNDDGAERYPTTRPGEYLSRRLEQLEKVIQSLEQAD